MFASTNEPAVRDLDASIYSERKFFTLVLEKWPLWVIALGDALLTQCTPPKRRKPLKAIPCSFVWVPLSDHMSFIWEKPSGRRDWPTVTVTQDTLCAGSR